MECQQMPRATMPKSFKDLTGQRFTRLLVVSKAPSDANGNAKWNCQCDCGNTTVSHGFSLRNGRVKSCGCLTTEQLIQRITTHKLSKTPEYRCWAGMLQRCTNPKNKKYPRYGARGIKVCERWMQFENFYADMGPRPSGDYSIERIDNNGNYEPGNTKWATKSEQNHNKGNNHYVVYQGHRMTLTRAIEKSGNTIFLSVVNARLSRGWSIEDAIETSTEVFDNANFSNLVGQRFSRLTVLSRSENDKHGKARWLCLCDCGTETIVGTGSLKSGSIRSCGCLLRETARQTRLSHGMTGTPEYYAWSDMLKRCPNEVCERWRDFANFYADMGKKPSPSHRFKRIDQTRDFGPGNATWLEKGSAIYPR